MKALKVERNGPTPLSPPSPRPFGPWGGGRKILAPMGNELRKSYLCNYSASHIPFGAPAKRRKGPKSPHEETVYIRIGIAGERLNGYFYLYLSSLCS